ncbi:MAG: copper chaperone [Cyclobacteriaceae bacterium]|jgi:copper chaperone
MESITFKSAIQCSNCEAKVKTQLDKYSEISSWHVDLSHEDRLLTVESSLSADEIQKIVMKAGFKTETLVG